MLSGRGQTTTGAEMGLLEAAKAQLRAGQLAQARACFAEALVEAERDGDNDAFGKAALGMCGIWVQEQREAVDRAALMTALEQALTRAPAASLLRARVNVRLAAEAVYDGGPVAAVESAVGAVRDYGDDGAIAESLSLLHHVQLAPWHAHSRLALAEELMRLAVRASDPLLTLMGLCWRTVDLFLLGDVRATQSLHELRERAAAQRCEAIAFIGDVLRAMVEARSGHLDRAEEMARTARERGLAAGDPDAPAYFGAMMAALRHWQGRDSEVIDMVRTSSTLPHLGANAHVYVAAGAALSAAIGDRDSAEEGLAQLRSFGLDRLPESSSWLTTQALLAETAFRLGDAAVARDVSVLVAPFAELPVMPSLAVVCFGSGWRIMGLTAAVLGDLDSAVQHQETALAADRRLGNRPLSTITEHELAWLLRARGGDEDGARADALVRRAGERAGRIGIALAEPPGWLAEAMLASARTRSRTAATVPGRLATLAQTRHGWRVDVEGRSTVLGDLVGFSYLAILLSAPGIDHDALGLASGFVPALANEAEALIDAAALRDYRARAREVIQALADPGLPTTSEKRLREELQAITVAVRGGTAVGGRIRSFPTNQERARTAVRKALMRAVAAVTNVEPDLGPALRDGITTGATCRFEPTGAWSLRVSRLSSG